MRACKDIEKEDRRKEEETMTVIKIIVGAVIAAGILYCFLHTAPDTYRQIRNMFKDGSIWNDEFEETV